MQPLNDLIHDIATQFGLGNKATILVARTAASLFDDKRGGMKGFLDRLEELGQAQQVKAWLRGEVYSQPLDVGWVDQLLGAESIAATGREAGLANARVRVVMAYLIPELVRRFSRQGAIPETQPEEVKRLLAGGGDRFMTPLVRPSGNYTHRRTPRKVKTVHSGPSPLWGWGVVILLASASYMVYQIASEHKRKPASQDAVTQASPENRVSPASETSAPAHAPTHSAARLTLRNTDGRIEFSGVVNDPNSQSMVTSKLKAVFGVDRVSGHLLVNPLVDAPPWLFGLDRLLPRLGISGLDIRLDGLNVKVGGWLSQAERQSVLEVIKPALGPSFQFGFLRDEPTEIIQDRHDQTLLSLMAMNASTPAEDLVKALNGWVIGFAPGGTEFPQAGRDIVTRTAYLMRSLVHPVMIEVGGHIDTQGDSASDLMFSTARANSVRDALVSAGVPDWMVKVQGYGNTRPLMAASNDYGRFWNRRIEFSILQPCDAAHPCTPAVPPPVAAPVTEGRPAPVSAQPDPAIIREPPSSIRPDRRAPSPESSAPAPVKPTPKSPSKPVTIQELF